MWYECWFEETTVGFLSEYPILDTRRPALRGIAREGSSHLVEGAGVTVHHSLSVALRLGLLVLDFALCLTLLARRLPRLKASHVANPPLDPPDGVFDASVRIAEQRRKKKKDKVSPLIYSILCTSTTVYCTDDSTMIAYSLHNVSIGEEPVRGDGVCMNNDAIGGVVAVFCEDSRERRFGLSDSYPGPLSPLDFTRSYRFWQGSRFSGPLVLSRIIGDSSGSGAVVGFRVGHPNNIATMSCKTKRVGCGLPYTICGMPVSTPPRHRCHLSLLPVHRGRRYQHRAQTSEPSPKRVFLIGDHRVARKVRDNSKWMIGWRQREIKRQLRISSISDMFE